MMREIENNDKFNINPILNEMKNVLENGLNLILEEYIVKFNMYEENYNAVLNLPAVKNSISANSSLSSSVNNINIYKNFNNKLNALYKENDELKAEISRLKKQNIIDLTEEVYIKVEPGLDDTSSSVVINNDSTSLIDESVIVENKNSEKENITLDIEEQSVNDNNDNNNDNNNDINESSSEEEEEEEEAEEEEEEEDQDLKIKKQEEELYNSALFEKIKDNQQDVKVEEVEEVAVEEEEVDEEEVEVEKEEVEDEKEEDEVETENESEKEEEEDLFEIEIDDKTYCTNNEVNGFIYELTDDGCGDKVGYFKDEEPFFYCDEK